MNRRIKKIVICLGFILILVAAIVFGWKYITTKPPLEQLSGFHFSSLNNLHSNKTIMDDYQDYIQKLPQTKKEFVGSVDFLEDGTGEHAVDIKIGVNGTWWRHILIYDKENKRIKSIVYKTGGYRS